MSTSPASRVRGVPVLAPMVAPMLLLLAGCAGQEPGAFAPRGSHADEVAWLFWVMVALGTLVFLLVLAVFARAVQASRRRSFDEGAAADDTAARRRSMRLVIGGGVVLPVVVLVPLTVMMLIVAERISPHAADEPLEIHVIGHQFWWEIIYPETGAVTANEIRIPTNTPVQLRMESADVIHSVWVAQLAGKIDMIPGQTTWLEIDANEPGQYLGHCAEFCGVQHARMRFLVIAEEPDDFQAWLDNESAPALEPDSDSALLGQEVFLEVGCGACHTVRGTEAIGDAGPDLTHLATRRTLGAATLPNERGHLGGWITDPQAVKPGNPMPPTPLTGEQLLALIDYLEGLE